MTLRIEAGLPLVDVEWHNSRLAFTDHDGSRPRSSASAGCSAASATATAPVRRRARRSAASWSTARRAGRPSGSSSTGDDWDRLYREAGLFPPKDEHPLPYESMLLRRRAGARRSATARASSTPPCSSGTSASPGSAPTSRPPAPSCTSSSPSTTTTPRSGATTTMPFFNPDEEDGEAMSSPRVRRDRRRRRPQRPDQRGVPRQGRPAHAGAGAERHGRRRGDHRGAAARASTSRRSPTR